MALKRLDTKSLPNDRHLGFGQQVYSVVRGYSQTGDTPYMQRKAALEAALTAEDEAYRASRKNFNTDKMHEEDGLRDAYIKAARTILEGHTQLPDSEAAKQRAVEQLQVWKDYKFSPSDSYTGESTKIDNMMQVFTERKSVLESLGVWAYLEKAQEHNEQVKVYFQIRNQENAEIEAGALKAARLVTDQAYRDLLDVLDALHILDPKALHPAVWKQLDELVDYYKQYYINRKSSSKKKA